MKKHIASSLLGLALLGAAATAPRTDRTRLQLGRFQCPASVSAMHPPWVIRYPGNYISVIAAGDPADATWVGGVDATYANAHFESLDHTAETTFNLPEDATGISLNFSDFTADDRALLLLNNTIIGGMALVNSGNGYMVYTDGGALTPLDFSTLNQNGSMENVSGAVTTGFNIGGANTLEMIINNTDGGKSRHTHGLYLV